MSLVNKFASLKETPLTEVCLYQVLLTMAANKELLQDQNIINRFHLHIENRVNKVSNVFQQELIYL